MASLLGGRCSSSEEWAAITFKKGLMDICLVANEDSGDKAATSLRPRNPRPTYAATGRGPTERRSCARTDPSRQDPSSEFQALGLARNGALLPRTSLNL